MANIGIDYSITAPNGAYAYQEGVILGDSFLSREDFRLLFNDMIKNDSARIAMVRMKLATFPRITSIVEDLENGGTKTVVEFTSKVTALQDIFQNELFDATKYGSLGGNISLFTAFNIGDINKMEVYHLMNEKELPSSISNDMIQQQRYNNTNRQLIELQRQGANLVSLNSALKNHLQNFITQLNTTQSVATRRTWHQWAGVNAPELNNPRSKNGYSRHFKNLANMFWRRSTNKVGYATEAFGAHMALFHVQDLLNSTQTIVNNSVINELGGYTSHSLLSMLMSTKGNTMSQLSGDIVVIGPGGKVQFNIQSKGSTKGAYTFTITYKKMIQNLQLFLDTYEKYVFSQINGISEEDLTALFNAFKTQAWVPIKDSLNQGINSVVDNLTKLT